MVLGLGYAEVIMVVGVSAMLFGTKDLPKLAKFGGRGVGWAVGYLQQARGHLQEMGGTSEMVKIHREMQETMYQLRAIQDEVRHGTNILNPTTTIRPPPRSMQIQPPSVETPSSIAENPPKNPSADSVSKSLDRIEGKLQKFQGFAAGGLEMGPNAAKSTEQSAGFDQVGKQMPGGGGKCPTPIPVSAVSAGLIKGNAQSGSDIVLDALLEEQVASQAQAFLESEVSQK
ncbi:hypothetical protein BSKO_09746 [Bryopsis sp. KO-2023]|nr:hypothetical protein BSKO_09746 [Bryopsis sp. KO-2023]